MAVYTQTEAPALVIDKVYLQTTTSVGDGGSIIKTYNWAVHYTPSGRDQTILCIGSTANSAAAEQTTPVIHKDLTKDNFLANALPSINLHAQYVTATNQEELSWRS